MNKLINIHATPLSKEWKQKVQSELKGLDYNETLVWNTHEGIDVKPIYTKEDLDYAKLQPLPRSNKDWKIISKFTNNKNQDSSYLYGYTISLAQLEEKPSIAEHLDLFISYSAGDSLNKINTYPNLKYLDLDILSQLAVNGNWLENSQEKSFELVQKALNDNSLAKAISIDTTSYQNAGASITQQLALALSEAVEYLDIYGEKIASKMFFKFALGGNYFFEIAKLRAFRFLWKLILEKYNTEEEAFIYAESSLRNKSTLDIYNNIIRSSFETSAAILGSADAVYTHSYELNDTSDFGIELASKQQLLLQKEAYHDKFTDAVAGAYYIESITNQIGENALELFKQWNKSGGFIKNLHKHTIQNAIQGAAAKEQTDFDEEKTVLIGVNKHRNKAEQAIPKKETTQNERKVLFPVVFPKRLAVAEELK